MLQLSMFGWSFAPTYAAHVLRTTHDHSRHLYVRDAFSPWLSIHVFIDRLTSSSCFTCVCITKLYCYPPCCLRNCGSQFTTGAVQQPYINNLRCIQNHNTILWMKYKKGRIQRALAFAQDVARREVWQSEEIAYNWISILRNPLYTSVTSRWSLYSVCNPPDSDVACTFAKCDIAHTS